MGLTGILIPEPRPFAAVAEAAHAALAARPGLRIVRIVTAALDAPGSLALASSHAAIERGARDECHCASGAVVVL